MPNGKKVRVDIVGQPKDDLWASIYTRMTPAEYLSLKAFENVDVAKKIVTAISRQFKQLQKTVEGRRDWRFVPDPWNQASPRRSGGDDC
jgi:hypothetical protein